MAIQTLHDTGIDIPSKFDGGVYAVATTDCVIQGIGDEFTLNYTSDSRSITFNAGSQAIIGGAFFHVTSSTTIELTANTTIYLCAEIDLSRADGNRGIFKERTSSNMMFENINGSGIVRDLLLYVVTTNANGVTSVQDRRVIKQKPSNSWYDLTDRPDINDGALLIKRNGESLGLFTANQPNTSTININVPTKVSELTNDKNYATVSQLNTAVNGVFVGIDSSRVLINTTRTTEINWTATEDCWVVECYGAAYHGIYLDNVMIWGNSGGSYGSGQPFPMKKGQKIRIPIAQWQTERGDTVTLKAYGVKR